MIKQNKLHIFKKLTSVAVAATIAVSMFANVTAYASTPKAPTWKKNGTVKYTMVKFGKYPQSEVSAYTEGADKFSRIVNAGYDSNGDAWVDGTKYRRIKKSDATEAYDNPSMYYWSDSTSYHYFKYEPIKWRVLELKNGKALLLSEYALDDKKYNATQNYVMWNIKWKNSTIRSWLNGYKAGANACKINYSKKNFIDTAFSTSDQKSLLKRSMGSGAKDKVFLLSEKDVSGGITAYGHGFAKETFKNAARSCASTKYCWAMGSYRYGNKVWWWLQSPNYCSDSAPRVLSEGEVDWDGTNMDNDAGAIRPAIIISSAKLKKLCK